MPAEQPILALNALAAQAVGGGGTEVNRNLIALCLRLLESGLQVSSSGVISTTVTPNFPGIGSSSVVRASVATLSNVAASTSSTTLLASNTGRLGLVIVNDSDAILYVKYGTGASSTSFTRKLEPGEHMEDELYTGIVTGAWATATGNARVTELTQ